MSFADTYQHEVLQSRRDRSRRAFFWARVVGLALMITIFATLRAEPQLRSLLIAAGTSGVMHIAGMNDGQTGSTTEPSASGSGALPLSRVKVNRPGARPPTSAQPDTGALARTVGETLGKRAVSN